MKDNLQTFLDLISFDTKADPESTTIPSSSKQIKLGEHLFRRLQELGLSDVTLDSYGRVYGTLPANTTENLHSIGFISHMDTSPDMPGNDVKALVYEKYSGGDLDLDAYGELVLSPSQFPILKKKIGKTIVTTSGNTLLGADDKAGITIILGLLDRLLYKGIPHGLIKVAFTCDEEIGRGTEMFDYEYFKGVDFAYTIDGSAPNVVEYECFNAASCIVEFKGVNIHPGSAKGKMINSIYLAFEFQNLLRSYPRPENTSDYQGFIHLNSGKLSVENSTLEFILREHDANKFQEQKNIMQRNASLLNDKNGDTVCFVTIKDQYKNMREYFKDNQKPIQVAYEAIKKNGITPISTPIRGGTDGAELTKNGILTPNLGTGGYNFHGRYEFLVLEELEQMIDICTTICGIKKA
jgi:tripeptide aminopeptidase